VANSWPRRNGRGGDAVAIEGRMSDQGAVRLQSVAALGHTTSLAGFREGASSDQPLPGTGAGDLAALIDARLDRREFASTYWEGSFFDYLDIVMRNPGVLRSAYQRLFDAVMCRDNEKYRTLKRDLVRYHFFADPFDHGADAIFGLDTALMQLADFLRSAAEGYGTDRRILLLHGPVASSKSTIARLLKKSLENYSRTDEGAMHSFTWLLDERCGPNSKHHAFPCPMHQEPLLLAPREAGAEMLSRLNEHHTASYGGGRLQLTGELDQFCRPTHAELVNHCGGD